MKKKLLFITPELPYPLHSGGKAKTARLLAAMAERYEVTLVSPLKLEDADHLDTFQAQSPCSEHIHVAVNVPRTPANLLRSYWKGVPLNVHRTYSSELADQVAEICDDHDIVLLDHYEVFSYLPQDYRGTVVYHSHNAYFKLWERYAETASNPLMAFAAAREARRVKQFEVGVAQAADLVFAAPNDGEELVAQGVSPTRIQDTFHLGDDSQLALPDLCFENSSKSLMYVGYLGWEPNARGLEWFIEKVWPALQAQHPDLQFHIAGKNPDEGLRRAVAAHPNIHLLGFVEDLQELYSEARVSVAPLLFGSGMKVKLLDAMARGMPTVTTSVGAEGIAASSGEQLLIADEPVTMAAAIERLLADADLWDHVQRSSRQLVKERYTWDALFQNMHRAMELSCAS